MIDLVKAYQTAAQSALDAFRADLSDILHKASADMTTAIAKCMNALDTADNQFSTEAHGRVTGVTTTIANTMRSFVGEPEPPPVQPSPATQSMRLLETVLEGEPQEVTHEEDYTPK